MENDIDPICGFTVDEKKCHNSLMECLKIFRQLPVQHPSEMKDFVGAVHRIQDLLAMRIVRRLYPKGWTNNSG